MKVILKRFIEGSFSEKEYEVPLEGKPTVLEVLIYIKENIDPSLSFRAMCRASICGTCAVKVNGEHKLACNTRVDTEELLIEPVDGAKVLKDLVVSHKEIYEGLKKFSVWITPSQENVDVKPSDIKIASKAWDCILCGICNNVCPPLLEGKAFAGPSTLTKAYKTIEDPRNSEVEPKLRLLTSVQECVHCSNCNINCPKGCMPEKWINLIETKLASAGYIQKKEQDFGFLGF